MFRAAKEVKITENKFLKLLMRKSVQEIKGLAQGHWASKGHRLC